MEVQLNFANEIVMDIVVYAVLAILLTTLVVGGALSLLSVGKCSHCAKNVFQWQKYFRFVWTVDEAYYHKDTKRCGSPVHQKCAEEEPKWKRHKWDADGVKTIP